MSARFVGGPLDGTSWDDWTPTPGSYVEFGSDDLAWKGRYVTAAEPDDDSEPQALHWHQADA